MEECSFTPKISKPYTRRDPDFKPIKTKKKPTVPKAVVKRQVRHQAANNPFEQAQESSPPRDSYMCLGFGIHLDLHTDHGV